MFQKYAELKQSREKSRPWNWNPQKQKSLPPGVPNSKTRICAYPRLSVSRNPAWALVAETGKKYMTFIVNMGLHLFAQQISTADPA